MGETCRQRAERDELLPLARQRVDVPHGLEEPDDEVHGEREPGAREPSQRVGGDAEHPSVADRADFLD